MTLDEAKQLRRLLERTTENMTDNEIVDFPAFVEKWKPGASYPVGKRVSYDGVVYKVLQVHNSQTDWTPDKAVSLFAKVLIPSDENGNQTSVPEWEQPGSTNPYMAGERVTYNGKVWTSTIDNNVWAPDVYGWSEVLE